MFPSRDRTARGIRDLHRSVKGTDALGRRYHALDPETYWWAHITLYRSIELVPRRWTAGGLDDAQLEALYAEGVTWYRRYGVSDRVVPPTRADYTARFRESGRVVPPSLQRRPMVRLARQSTLSSTA